ncbi:MAG TPA: hypothetical protein VMT34_00665 [Aggregatilineales bacterium]|nr:hypothetical protein [Aggregatilineales bacterium]
MTDENQNDQGSGSNPPDPFSNFDPKAYLRKRPTLRSSGLDDEEVGEDDYGVRRRGRMPGEDFEDEFDDPLGEGAMLMGREGLGEHGGLERGGLFGGTNLISWAIRIVIVVFALGFVCAALVFLLILTRH